jgi:hypothetical protein
MSNAKLEIGLEMIWAAKRQLPKELCMIRMAIVSLAIGVCAMLPVSAAADGPEIIAEGAWSKTVADSAGYGLRGRLLIGSNLGPKDGREYAVYLELQEVSQFTGDDLQLYCDLGRTAFRPEYKQGLRCELRNSEGTLVKPTASPFGGGMPKSRWVVVPKDGMVRLRTTPFGLYREKAIALAIGSDGLWVIPEGEGKDYSLSGAFVIDPVSSNHPKSEGRVWRGTLELPPVPIGSKSAE